MPLISSFKAAPLRLGMLRPDIPAIEPDRNVTDSSNSSVERRIPEPPTRQERIPQAILYMIAAGVIFSFSSAASKWLVATYPVGEVLFSRVFVSLILFSAFALPTAGWAVLHTRRPTAHVLRSMSQFTSQTLLLIAFSMMPLASATAINFQCAAVCSTRLAGVPQGADRHSEIVRAGGRISRRVDRHQSGQRDVPDRRVVRARQCLAVRHGNRGRPRHDHDRVRPRR